jgi:hypothetical protein
VKRLGEARQKKEEEARNFKERRKLTEFSKMLDEAATHLPLADDQGPTGVWDEAAAKKARDMLEAAKIQVEEVRKMLGEKSNAAPSVAETSLHVEFGSEGTNDPEVDTIKSLSQFPVSSDSNSLLKAVN